MSNLLERAIIDAKALKEAALKNAEQLVIEKYSREVKEAMNSLLEEEEIGAMEDLFGADDGTETVPGSQEDEQDPTDAEEEISLQDVEAQLPDAFSASDEELVRIKLDSLEAEFDDEEEDGRFGGDDEFGDDEIGIDIEDDSDLNFSEPENNIGLSIDAPTGAQALEEMIEDTLLDMFSNELNEASQDNDGDGFVVPAWAKGEKPPKWADQDDNDPEVGDALPESNEETTDESTCSKREYKKKIYEEDLDEEVDLDEEIDLDELMERIRVEGEPQKSGWAGTPESVMREYESMLLAREQDSEVKEENEELRKTVAALQKENKTLASAANKLQEQNKKFNTAFKALQEKLETMNVSNAKLLYINQALENASLNERQKRKIVEAISKAETVQEAKIVFDTTNDTVATNSDVKRETTLSEMVSRKSSLLVAARKEQKTQDANPLFNRMQKLAGIKTK